MKIRKKKRTKTKTLRTLRTPKQEGNKWKMIYSGEKNEQ